MLPTTTNSTNSSEPQITTLTIYSILKDKPVSINSICKQGEIQTTDVRAALVKVIVSGSKLLAEYKRPKTEMVLFVVNLITDRYSHLSIDDVKLCMSNLFTGLYGEIIALDIERFGKALSTYSEEKRLAAVNFNPAPEKSNQFPRKDHRVSYKMPEKIRELLKRDIGYEFKKPEKMTKPQRIDWKTRLPGLTDQEIKIYEYFDDLWYEQHCRLQPVKDGLQLVEVDGKDMTRGEFVHHAKKLIEQNK